jgi:hypothetical protein
MVEPAAGRELGRSRLAGVEDVTASAVRRLPSCVARTARRSVTAPLHAVDVPNLDVDESTSAARICFNLTMPDLA